MFHRFANPARFLRMSAALLPWTAALTLVLMATGFYLALAGSPADYQQGESVRILYVHVPAAWMALFCYASLAAASAVAIIWKHLLADLVAKATAPVGACFTFLALVTGSLWGKPMWGTWWVWDARLTSVLILFFLYLGYMALRGAFDSQRAAPRRRRSWPWSVLSTCRSSSFPWTGGTRCISRPACSRWTARPSTPRCWRRSW